MKLAVFLETKKNSLPLGLHDHDHPNIAESLVGCQSGCADTRYVAFVGRQRGCRNLSHHPLWRPKAVNIP